MIKTINFTYNGELGLTTVKVSNEDPSNHGVPIGKEWVELQQEIFDQLDDSGKFTRNDLENISEMSTAAFLKCLHGDDPKEEINMTPLSTLKKNGWWESGVKNIVEMKEEIERLDRKGIKRLSGIHTLTHNHAIAYFVSFGFKETTHHTIEGTKTMLEWK